MDEATDEIREALQRFQLFSDVLSPVQLDGLGGQCRPVLFKAGSKLMVQGEFGTSVFCITDGMVSLTVDRGHDFRKLGAGNAVGEMELLTGARRTATVAALTDVHALEITKPALLELFPGSPVLIENFEAVFAIRQEMLEQMIGNAASVEEWFRRPGRTRSRAPSRLGEAARLELSADCSQLPATKRPRIGQV